LPIFGEKIGVFSLKTDVMIKILHTKISFVLSQKRQFFAEFFGGLCGRTMSGRACLPSPQGCKQGCHLESSHHLLL
jgi:hypothetical protein